MASSGTGYDQALKHQDTAKPSCPSAMPAYDGETQSQNRDQINRLPNCVLLSILSFLTLKEAVITSILGRRWRNLWKDLWLKRPNLEFDIPNVFGSQYAQLIDINEEDYCDYGDRGPKRFERQQFVNRLLGGFYCYFPNTYLGEKQLDYCDYGDRGPKRFERQQFVNVVNTFLGFYLGEKLDSFKVAFLLDGNSTRDLDNWVRFAITKGAQKLHLHLTGGLETVYRFPHWILSESDSAVLKHLSLKRCALGPPPSHFDRYSDITTLWLDNVIVNSTLMEKLFSVFLNLESLTLKSCSIGSTLAVAGAHPGDQSLRLQELKLLQCYELERIRIDAVNLTSLEFEGNILVISYFDAPRLERVFLCARAKFILPHELTIFASLPELQTLNLHLGHGVELPKNIPTFGNLRLLDLDSWTFDTGVLVKLLTATPLLDELVLTVYATDRQQKMRNQSGLISHDHLKRVKLQRFHSNSYMIELAICILEIATNLETMVIDPLGKLYEGGGVWLEVCRNECEDGYTDEDEDLDMLDDCDGVENKDGSDYEEEEEEEEEDGSEEDKDDEEDNDDDERRAYASWEDKGRTIVQEKLNGVMSNARILIL